MQPMGPAATAPAPGWYPDPGGSGGMRWWDGATWTEHQTGWQPPYGAGAPAGMGHELDWVLPVNRDGYAIAAGYLALFSFIPNPFTSSAALVCGLVALRRMKTSGKLGRGRAIFGVVMGGLVLTLFAVVIIAAALHPNNN